MKILNLLHFVKVINTGEIGIAVNGGTFASTGWCISDEHFHIIRGNKFSWYAPDGNLYIDGKGIFSRPTEEEVLKGISPQLKDKALSLKLIIEN